MVLEVNEKASKEFVLEYLNVANSYRDILKHPNRRPKNLFRRLKELMIASAVLIIISIVMYIIESQKMMIALAFLFLAIFIFAAKILIMNKKIVDDALAHDAKSKIKIDEDGVQITKDKNYNVTLPWENMFGVCVLSESITFLPSDQTGIIIAVPIRYSGDVLGEVKSLGHEDLILKFKK